MKVRMISGSPFLDSTKCDLNRPIGVVDDPVWTVRCEVYWPLAEALATVSAILRSVNDEA